jgi:hypothetical protein
VNDPLGMEIGDRLGDDAYEVAGIPLIIGCAREFPAPNELKRREKGLTAFSTYAIKEFASGTQVCDEINCRES